MRDAGTSSSSATPLKVDRAHGADLAREAVAAHDRGELELAQGLYQRLLESHPGQAWVYNNLGHVFHGMGAFTDAEESYYRAIELDPTLADAHWNLCSLQLLRGDFASAWPRFHYRRAVSRLPTRPPTKPVWQGQQLAGESILLHKEFGFGDTIQFARYVPLVAQRGGRVVLEVQPELMRLFQTLDGVEILVKRGSELPQHGFECGLMELARLFGATVENVPADPYLAVNPVLAREWRQRLRPGFNVGLVWSGNPNFPDARYKCIDLRDIAPLFEVRGVTWVPLQTGAAAEQVDHAPAGAALQLIATRLADFAETAAVIENLELVITVDTAVAHLAGAIGKPVWLLLPAVPDWRWFLDREDSPWYPTMRIFRQTERGAWRPLIERVAGELRHLVAARPLSLMQRLRGRLTKRL